jgi:bifunctional non-homologous end joining protein LigD
LPHGAAWAFEVKWDGVRALVRVHGAAVQITGRNGRDITHRYPEVHALADALEGRDALFDGEIIACDADGLPSFERLQERMHVDDLAAVQRLVREVPVVYMIFDAVYLDGRRLFDEPYLERRARLLDLGLSGPSWQTPENLVGDGESMLQGSQAAGLEGVMAKRIDSRYEQGRRSGAWLKVKNHLTQELVIGGWAEGEGKRRGLPGALLVGYWDDGRLVYAGKVGTGFTDDTLERLARLLAPLARDGSPFDAGTPPPRSHFVEPKLVGEFKFAEWTKGGQLRAPVFRGLRDDKDAREVVRERAVQ